MIATTQSQSERLLACGVSPDTADMNWTDFIPDEPVLAVGEPFYRLDDDLKPVLDSSGKPIYECSPAWSLDRLLELLPEKIDGGYWLTVQKCAKGEDEPVYYGIAYYKCKWDNPENPYDSTITTAGCKNYFTSRSGLIEAAVRMIEWLVSENYALNKLHKSHPTHKQQ